MHLTAVSSGGGLDPTVVYTATIGLVGTVIGVVAEVMRRGRKRERTEDDSLASKQDDILVQPMVRELDRVRAQLDAAISQRETAWRARDRAYSDRAVLIALCKTNGIAVPEEIQR